MQAVETGALRDIDTSETRVEQEEIELEREDRVAKKQPSDPAPEVIGCGFTSAGDSRMLCTQAKQQLPFQEFVLDPPFLPTLCHGLCDAAGSLRLPHVHPPKRAAPDFYSRWGRWRSIGAAGPGKGVPRPAEVEATPGIG